MELLKDRRIQKLNDQVVNQIAAGEVVERPAHMVKELIENSLDAGSTEIHLEISNGGRNLVLQDNGIGMVSKDLDLAFLRHTTSKISQIEDLQQIRSFGFRGEALSSIASVCRLKITSRRQDQELGNFRKLDFGVQAQGSPISCLPGTRIQVDDLFENVPARLKFLKSPGAEVLQIRTVVKALSLAHPQAQFKVTQNGELLDFFPAVKNWSERAQQILNLKKGYAAVSDVQDLGGVQVDVFISDPQDVAKTSKNIWIFVQNRWIQDKAIQAAIFEGYRNFLMHGEFPYVVVQLKLPPEEIDVNVHPAKSQVKFLNPSSIFRAVHQQIRRTLEENIQKTKPFEIGAAAQPNFWQSELTAAAGRSPEVAQPVMRAAFGFDTLVSGQVSNEVSESGPAMPATSQRIGFDQISYRQLPAKTSPQAHQTNDRTIQDPHFEKKWQDLQVIGQVHSTYIIAQAKNSLVMIDQHAAHERVLFEKLQESFSKNHFEIQDFLFPLTFDVPEDLVESLEKNYLQLKEFGIELERFGPSTFGVKSAPYFLKEKALIDGILSTAHEWASSGGSFHFEKLRGDLFSTMACHSAVRAGHAMSVEESRALLQQMDDYPLSSFCPHGRPVSFHLTWNEIEKKFGRLG